jgi:hypothetical protein
MTKHNIKSQWHRQFKYEGSILHMDQEVRKKNFMPDVAQCNVGMSMTPQHLSIHEYGLTFCRRDNCTKQRELHACTTKATSKKNSSPHHMH